MTRSQAERELRSLVAKHVAATGARTAKQITAAITSAVAYWLRWLGATSVQTEYPMPFSTRLRRRNGRIDVVGTWQSGARMAVEIDHQDKDVSLEKLLEARAQGMRVLWVRWDTGRDRDVNTIAVCNVERQARMFRDSAVRTRSAVSFLFDK